MRILRVLHIISDLRAGGAERALANLVVNADGAEFDHQVVCLIEGGFYTPMVAEAGTAPIILGGKGVRALPGWIWKIRRLVRQLRPDIVQSWMYYPNLISLAALDFRLLRPTGKAIWGLRCSDMDLDLYPKNLRRVVRLGAWFSNRVDCIVANSHAGLDHHIKIGYRNRDFRVIENGFDSQRFRPDAALRAAARAQLGLAADDFAAGIAARCDPMKGYLVALEAFGQSSGLRSFAVGSDTETLSGPAGFRGLGRKTDMAAMHNAFDVLVSASLFGEGMSNSIGEAMACGVPVIATDVGDARRMLFGGDDLPPAGIVVPPGDAGAIARALDALKDDPQRRQALGAAGRARVPARYTIERCVQAHETLYRELAGR